MQSLDGLLQLAIEAQALRYIISHLVVVPQQALKPLLCRLQATLGFCPAAIGTNLTYNARVELMYIGFLCAF